MSKIVKNIGDFFSEAEQMKAQADEIREKLISDGIQNPSQTRIAQELGLKQGTLSNKLRLLTYTEEERQKIIESGLTERHARSILSITDPAERLEILNKVCTDKLSVIKTERLIKESRNKVINIADIVGETAPTTGTVTGTVEIAECLNKSTRESIEEALTETQSME